MLCANGLVLLPSHKARSSCLLCRLLFLLGGLVPMLDSVVLLLLWYETPSLNTDENLPQSGSDFSHLIPEPFISSCQASDILHVCSLTTKKDRAFVE